MLRIKSVYCKKYALSHITKLSSFNIFPEYSISKGELTVLLERD